MNLANKLTILRIILVPIFLLFIAIKIPYGTIIATMVFIIAALTDKLDGYIARSRNQITRFGKFMDPLADKLLVTAALVSLVELQIIPAWAAIIIIAREFAVTGLRSIAAAEGIVISASWWGKVKTVIQIVAIIFALFKVILKTMPETIPELAKSISNSPKLLEFFNVMPGITMAIAIVITIISGVDYFSKNKAVIKVDR
jgi:CDP-diacylglycerol--glycerol-3-phosphate 3-phosphatidyltransferase